MAQATKEPSHLLPHNPVTAAGAMDELKRLRGDKPWLEFELELLAAHYPDNAVFKGALETYRAKALTVPQATPPLVTAPAPAPAPATAATPAPAQAAADKANPAPDATAAKAPTKPRPASPKGQAAKNTEEGK